MREDDGATASTSYTLIKNSELRLECGEKEVTITLEDGSAEVFGAELHKGKQVCVTGQKLAVYTWTGCRVSVYGKPNVIYTAEETPMVEYLNLHTVLTARREEAAASGTQGPRIVIVGPTDSGKSTLALMLVNWAVRAGWEPTMVDVDVGQGTLTVPGSIAATPVDTPVDIEEGYPLDAPLVFFYGHASPADSPALYKYLVERLAGILDKRAQASPQVAAAGMIINTLGWVDGPGYDIQRHVIGAFQADVVVVMEQDRLGNQLSVDLKGSNPPVSLIKLAKSGGVVQREKEERRNARDARIHAYFYGAKTKLSPETTQVRSDSLVVYRIGGGPRAPNSAMPLGGGSGPDPLRLTHLPANAELVQSLLAVSHAGTPDQILSMNVAGFALVKDVDSARGLITYTLPCPGPLPGRYLVMGSLRSAID